ncbi:hypothetical protein VN12_02500 [Pirellula sp. SH-Sr6A]|uniref:hypothetical protein n=1 Tax=Pirellula sp. SH-Sr6A TaxID=1632865 RepID=UPI00078E5DD8|nr:hypothetical protein [Pirellula sp. SH-Sr6A]AMV30957.1 hypothetical protein VN12_02500 [Pirellula sp. SH-Sr6A]
MSINKTRKKNSRFYWAELGFLALGLVGLNPSLLTDLLIGSTVPVPQNIPSQPLYGYPPPTSAPYGAYPGNPYTDNGWHGATPNYQPTAYFPQSSYANPQTAGGLISQPDIQLLASRVGEYLSGSASQWWGSQQTPSATPDLRPSTAGLANPYAASYPNYQYQSSTQFGASNGYAGGWQLNQPSAGLPSTGTPSTVPPPNYSQPYAAPLPSTSGATYSAQLPSGASYLNAPASPAAGAPSPNLVRGYSSNYQTLANPGSFVPAGSTSNVLQQRQTQPTYPAPPTQGPGGWTNPATQTIPPSTGGYYGRR